MVKTVKFGLVSAEILHYIENRTHVAWANAAGTNVPKTVVNIIRCPNQSVTIEMIWGPPTTN